MAAGTSGNTEASGRWPALAPNHLWRYEDETNMSLKRLMESSETVLLAWIVFVYSPQGFVRGYGGEDLPCPS